MYSDARGSDFVGILVPVPVLDRSPYFLALQPARAVEVPVKMNRLTPLIDRGWSVYQQSVDYYESLNPRAKLLLWCWIALHIIGGVAFWWIGWENIFACEHYISRLSVWAFVHPSPLTELPASGTGMARLADNVRKLSYGWLILSAIVVVSFHPFAILPKLDKNLRNLLVRSLRSLP